MIGYLVNLLYSEIDVQLFISTVAHVLQCGVVVKDFLVMDVNDAANVRHAAVAYFHIAHVKEGVEIVA